MKILTLTFVVFIAFFVSPEQVRGQGLERHATDTIPSQLKGDFMDDYGIRYTINDSTWIQHSKIKYHILYFNNTEQYLVAKNDDLNPSEAGLYTRIDYMSFTGMPPYEWGFCLTVYNAASDSLAAKATAADKTNPRKGCNGFPFSRMKRTKPR